MRGIEIKITGMAQVKKLLSEHGRRAKRALAVAMNQTCVQIMQAERKEMRRSFSQPTPWTLRSLAYWQASADNLQAEVYLNKPSRMHEHYLQPLVSGTTRKLKGFERGIAMSELVPSKYIRRDSRGNVNTGQIRQILSVLGAAEHTSGYSANMTRRSAGRGKQRDYVVIRHRRGRLIPGVYKREAVTGREFGAGERRLLANKSRAYQRGRTAMSGGRLFSRVVRARRLVPMLLAGRHHRYQRIFDFYGVAQRVIRRTLLPRFRATLRKFLRNP